MSRPRKFPQIQSQGALLGSQILHESQMHTSFHLAEGPQEVMRFVMQPLTCEVPNNLKHMSVSHGSLSYTGYHAHTQVRLCE